jgi:aldehyde dehydrogenase (NAD+)
MRIVSNLDFTPRRAEELARAISVEMGAPIDFARGSQVPCLPWHLKNFLKAFDRIEWMRPLGPHAPDNRIALEGIGVVGLITPWNWPMNQVKTPPFLPCVAVNIIAQVALKVIPALLAGCTCVLKPSEESPLSSALLAEVVHDAGDLAKFCSRVTFNHPR